MAPLLPLPVAMIAFAALFIVGRVLEERALKVLTTEQKGQLVEAFSGMRLVTLAPMFALIVLYLALGTATMAPATLHAIYFGGLLAFVAAMQVLVRNRLSKLGLPPGYLRLSGIGRTLKLAGLAVMLVSLPPS